MTEPTPSETRLGVSGDEATRSDILDSVVSFTQAAGGPAAAGWVATQAIKTTGEIIVAKINAGVENTKTYTDAGHPDGPGAHKK
jgi:hypothetical protein